MSRTETMGLTKRGMLQSSSCNRLMDRSESLKRDSVMSNGGAAKVKGSLERKKSKSFKEGESYASWLITEAPGSIAAVRREQVAAQQALRKLKIAHYGRSKSTLTNFNSSKVVPLIHPHPQRCSFLTPTSDPVHVAYHDEEWGVPVHDDKTLFELLTLSGAQVGSDWSSTLRKRHDFRKAFMEFEAEAVAKLSEKEMNAISIEHKIEMSKVRGVVENATKIVEIKKDFGSLEKYLWGFVNHKPISTNYKLGHKIPVKTSKSESISKDMVRRGFRFVGPTVVHSFMQAAGLTNDHLLTCYRHLPCTLLTTKP
ncbi:hypothetical protein EUTSA_v10021188mg [Eutrema salsugineum]|uniref:DNA-3-methyladenine glycosylase I n=1 Tax=Eutrema salsugineum TaxID=72664 RepID=V4NQA1_EUTSA|nr:uncharacterized protein LOC18024817 [Eutrema salsugineum]ESQ48756.1 hypothetical protein EUTSA_v10021188mg [Eutrema salsugineum]